MIRIGIDVRSLQTESGWRGVGVYTRNLIHSLIRIDRENEYLFFTSSPKGLQDFSRDDKKKIITLNRPTRNIFLWDQLFWHRLFKKYKIDIFHSAFYASPFVVPKNVALVQTVHDLIPLIFKESTSFKNRLLFRMNFFILKYIDRIIAVSQNTKSDLIRHLKIPEEKIVVIYNGINHFQGSNQEEKLIPLKDARMERPYLLYVGGMDPLKNIPILIQAFDKIAQKNKDLKLVLVGGDGEKIRHLKLIGKKNSGLMTKKQFDDLLEKLLNSGRIVLKRYLKTDHLASYYRNAELFVFPSLYEGFGFPPLEAMSFGLPVIASNRSSLPEILGEAAHYVNPENVEEIARSADHLLHNSSLKVELREAGFRRAAQFLWESTAQKTLALYQSLVTSKKRDQNSNV